MTETTPTPLPTADELRMEILRKEMAEIEARQAKRKQKEDDLRAFTEDFLHNHVSMDEVMEMRTRIAAAVQNEKFEALIYVFPSDLCSDRGRAINNHEDGWTETLQGKAREVYDLYVERAKTKGYRLKASIINFPDGMPGDVGFFLNWEPPRV